MSTPVADFGRLSIRAYGAVRIVLGLILLAAAGLKGHQLATGPVAETDLFTSRWFLIGVVESELLLGLWLLAGPYPRRTWQLAVLCFGGFACVSLYKAVSGEASCGCFGNVAVNPWYTLLLDLAAVAALLCWRPIRGPSPVPTSLAFSRRRAAAIATVSLIVGIPAALAMGNCRAAMVSPKGDILGDAEFVVLEPESWIGKPFPLLKHIDIGDQLAEGEWMVVMYHHKCLRCSEAVEEYNALAGALAAESDGLSVALIEMPPYGRMACPRCGDSPCVLGRLANVKQWFLTTPSVVVVDQGRVVEVNPRESAGRAVNGPAGGRHAT